MLTHALLIDRIQGFDACPGPGGMDANHIVHEVVHDRETVLLSFLLHVLSWLVNTSTLSYGVRLWFRYPKCRRSRL